MKGIILVRSGIINVIARVSLIHEFLIQELYAKCSYGSYAYFVDEKSKYRKSKFTLQATQAGQYFFIKYSQLD